MLIIKQYLFTHLKFFIYNSQNFSVFYCRSGKSTHVSPPATNYQGHCYQWRPLKWKNSQDTPTPPRSTRPPVFISLLPFLTWLRQLGRGGGNIQVSKNPLDCIFKSSKLKGYQNRDGNLEASDLDLESSETKWVEVPHSISGSDLSFVFQQNCIETPGSKFNSNISLWIETLWNSTGINNSPRHSSYHEIQLLSQCLFYVSTFKSVLKAQTETRGTCPWKEMCVLCNVGSNRVIFIILKSGQRRHSGQSFQPMKSASTLLSFLQWKEIFI